MYRHNHPCARLFRFLLIGLLCSLAPADTTSPPELTKLRQSWLDALHKGELEARADYAIRLKKLHRQATKSKKRQKIHQVEREIDSLKDLATGTRTISGSSATETLPGIKFARTLFKKKMTEMIEAKSKAYRTRLEKLQERYTASDQKDLALIIGHELTKLDSGEAIIEAGYAKHTGTSEQLEDFLAGTTWNVTDEKGQPGSFTFRAKGTVSMHMPWYIANWKVIEKRNVVMSHTEGHWSFNIRFSDDLKSFEGFKPGSPIAFWTGRKAPKSQ